jgi:hypothetical protein
MEIGFSKSLVAKFRSAADNRKVRKFTIPVLGIALLLQIYFLRELLAAELLFGLAFAVLLVLVGIFYVVGTIGERGLGGAEVVLRVILRSARRGYGALEVFGKKSLRHPESAQ